MVQEVIISLVSNGIQLIIVPLNQKQVYGLMVTEADQNYTLELVITMQQELRILLWLLIPQVRLVSGRRGPTQVLDVRSGAGIINIQSTTGTNRSYASFVNTGGAAYAGIENSGGGGIVGGSSGYAAVYGHSGAYSTQLATNNAVRMTIDSTGNVGIGTTAPGRLLDINGITRHRDLEYFGASDEQGTITWGASGFNIIANGTKALTLGSNGIADRLVMDTSGNVGIGSTSPTTFKLEVAGNIGPDADNTRDLGSSSRYYANIYANNIVGSGALGYWKRGVGVLYPNVLSDGIAATSSGTTVATFTSSGTNDALRSGGASNYATIGPTGSLTFNAVTNDIVTGTNEHLALMPNGTGMWGGNDGANTKIRCKWKY